MTPRILDLGTPIRSWLERWMSRGMISSRYPTLQQGDTTWSFASKGQWNSPPGQPSQTASSTTGMPCHLSSSNPTPWTRLNLVLTNISVKKLSIIRSKDGRVSTYSTSVSVYNFSSSFLPTPRCRTCTQTTRSVAGCQTTISKLDFEPFLGIC